MREEGMRRYATQLVNIISLYLIGSMKANKLLPTALKQLVNEVKAEEQKEAPKADLSDAEKARVDGQAAPASKAPKPRVDQEVVRPLAEELLHNYQDLSAVLQGKLGQDMIGSVNFLDLAYDLVLLLEELLQGTVYLDWLTV